MHAPVAHGDVLDRVQRRVAARFNAGVLFKCIEDLPAPVAVLLILQHVARMKFATMSQTPVIRNR